jgi:hypothetical protein
MIKYRSLILSGIISLLLLIESVFGQELVNVQQFGAVADAREVNGVWLGTDNSPSLNKCAAYCRANGQTMFFPKGNFGVASTVWLTNPDRDGLRQASITVVGYNRGAYLDQSTSTKICVLKDYKAGEMVKISKKDGVLKMEPDIVPIFAVSNGRQVHIEGLCFQGTNKKDLIAGVAIGNWSQFTSIKNCSFDNTYAGLVFPGIRKSANESVIEGCNDLLVVEQSTFVNAYNIVCGGTQPNACEYRNNSFFCSRSVFTGTLITNELNHSRGSHKFSSCLFETARDSQDEDTVYFDLATNEVTIDSCHFETAYKRKTIPEVIIRQFPMGGQAFKVNRIALTNNTINFAYCDKNPSKYRPIIDTMMGSKMIVQGNDFFIGTAVRIKAYGAIFIGNSFQIDAPHDLTVTDESHTLYGNTGDIVGGYYDFNHFIRGDSDVNISLPDKTPLKENVDYKVEKEKNAFQITDEGKKKIDGAKVNRVLISYRANDAKTIRLEAWGGNTFNPSRGGFCCKDLIAFGNKVVWKNDEGQLQESELQLKPEYKLNVKIFP